MPVDIPAGSFLEIAPDLIDEGRMMRKFTEQMQRALRDAVKVWEDEPNAGKLKLVLTVEFTNPNRDEIAIGYGMKIAAPASPGYSSVAKVMHGRVLVRPEGSAGDSPDQGLIPFYTHTGRVGGKIDRRTGELVSDTGDTTIAGKVGGA